MRTFLMSLLCLQLCTQVAFARHHSSSSSSSSEHEMSTKKADYIIVGLGTAGAVAARYLSDPIKGKHKNSVLVFEAGQNRTDDPAIFEGPPDLFSNVTELNYNPKYVFTKNCPDENPLTGFSSSEQYSTGRLWFGSSAHNYFFCARGSSDRWDELAAFVGNPEWSYNNLIPAMKFLETFHGTSTQPALRGTSGPLSVTQFQQLIPPGQPFANAVSNVTGAPITVDYNVPDGNTAVTVGQQYCTPDFQLRSYAYDFLPTSILNRDGTARDGRKLRVVSGAYVHRVIFNGNKAIGVEYFKENDNKAYTAYANKKVIISAGCPFSAALLQRSGIGPKSVLEQPKVNVPVLVDNSLVGDGLKTHYGVGFGMTQPEDPLNFEISAFVDMRNYFAPAGGGDNARRFVMPFQPYLIGAFPPVLLTALGINPAEPNIASFAWNLRPRSSGTAFIVDNSPFTPPDIRFNFFSDGGLDDEDSDLSAAVAAFNLAKGIADEAGCTMLYPPVWHYSLPQPESAAILAEDAIGGLAFSYATVTNHYSGTCQMGTDISNSVISSKDLHVHGVKNLMVADSSIYPFPATGNTAWQCYLAGLKAAKILGAEVP